MWDNTYLSLGDESEDVKKLQQALKENGANLQVDGVFGNQTYNALIKYQEDNGLDADGIAGPNTLNKMFGGTTDVSTDTTTTTTDTTTNTAPSSQDLINNKPGDFTWENQDQLDEKISAWLNRDQFSYDYANDPMYQQYKNQYTLLGNLAMQDTMGQAAAMTGGYGNSYAQTVGQQTYQGYMQQLNNMIPELYAMARNNYDAEGQQMYNEIALLEGQRNQAYNEHQGQLTDWYNYVGLTQNMENSNYSRLATLIQSGYVPTDDELAAAGMTRAQADALANANSGNGNGYVPNPNPNPDPNPEEIYNSAIEHLKTMPYSADPNSPEYQNVWNYLDELVAEGIITKNESSALWNRYISHQL